MAWRWGESAFPQSRTGARPNVLCYHILEGHGYRHPYFTWRGQISSDEPLPNAFRSLDCPFCETSGP